MKHRIPVAASAVVLCLTLLACTDSRTAGTHDSVTLTLGAFTVPKEAYQKKIIPAFQRFWQAKTGQTVQFAESYEASGAQSRAIRGGFEADVAALSLEKDITALADAGLITHDWKQATGGGFVTRSVVVIAYREGNPKQIRGLEDLKRADVQVIYPSPKTSGGAMWVVNTLYGAALKLSEVRSGTPDPAAARQQLKDIQRRVQVMDKSGRMSVTTFENGIGDALLTYENEALLRQKQGRPFPFVIPEATILIENPVALVDANVDRHGTRAVAEAFVAFLYTAASQQAFAEYGFRPVDPAVSAEFAATYPQPPHLFDVRYLGGWDTITDTLYDRDGVWTTIMRELADEP